MMYPIPSFDRPALRVLALTLLLFAAPASARAADISELYAPFAELLDDHLLEHHTGQGGLVTAFDYRAALDHPDTQARLEDQQRRLAGFDPDRLDARAPAIAFWLNAYNFFMISHILETAREDGLVDSVRDYGHLFNPYRVFRRDLFDVGGQRHSLSEIENDILLGEDFAARGWKDARVHFAVNCASVGCPPLLAKPYTADNVETLLETNTRQALKTGLHLDIRDETLYLTSLFDWYEAHFADQSGSVRAFIAEHVDDEHLAAIEQTRRTRFIDYDWDLNSPENMQPWMD